MSSETRVPYVPTQAMLNAWAELSGDHNPLHVSPEYARTTRFGGTIAHGPLGLAYMERVLMELHGEQWLHGGMLENVRFTAPVRPDHEYSVVADPVPGEERRWNVQIQTTDGEVCASGIASLPR